MNKYQEAFERLIKHLENLQILFISTGGYFFKENFENDKDLIQQLVDKATPKKPYLGKSETMAFLGKQDGHECMKMNIEGYHCPSCNEYICYKSMPYSRKPKYCRKCGQALDWSENDE